MPGLVAVAEVAVAGMTVAVAEMVVVAEVVAEVAAGAVEVAAAAGVVVVVEEAVRQAHLWAEGPAVPGVVPVAGDRLIVWRSLAFWCVVLFSFWRPPLRCRCTDVPHSWRASSSEQFLLRRVYPRLEC